MASNRKSKPTQPANDYVPEGLILYEADRALTCLIAWVPGALVTVDHGIDRSTRHEMAVVYLALPGRPEPVTGLTVLLTSYGGPVYGILAGGKVTDCEGLGDAIRRVAVKVEAAGQLSLAL